MKSREKKQHRVRLKIQPLNVPVARCKTYDLNTMAGHAFVTAHIGTNFELSPDQAGSIEGLIAGPNGPTLLERS